MDKKPEKLVPEVRFKGFTDDWEQHKLENVFTKYQKRINPTQQNLELWSLTIDQGLVAKTKRYDRSFLVRKNDIFNLVPKGYFVYNPMNITLGTIDVNKYHSIAVSGYYIVLKSNDQFNVAFLASLLHTSSMINKYKRFSTGSLLEKQRLQFPNFAKVKIISPRLSEQTKIGLLMNQVNNLIDLQQRKLEQLKQLKIFTLQRMFIDKDCKQPILRFKNFKDNWLPHKFNDIANTFSGGTPAISNKDYYGGNIPFIRSAEINKNTTQLHLTPDGLKNSSAKFIKKGTLLYALYGATSGEVGIAQIDGAINQAVMAITLKKDNVYFIKTWLIKNKRKIISTYLQGGQGNLSAKIVKHLKLSLPKIEEEKLISITIMKIDSLIKLQQSKIDDLVNLKKYLLQKLFI